MRYKYDEQYKSVLNKMPQSFSTFEINKAAKEFGVPNDAITNGYSHRFLSRYASRTGTSTWMKRNEQQKQKKVDQRYSKSFDLTNDNEIYEKVFDLMPARFTSFQFASKARELGASESPIRWGFIGVWLHSNTKVGRITLFKWYKLDDVALDAPIFNEHPQEVATQKPTELIESTPITLSSMITEQQAVGLLKSLGYRLMKPTTQWEEL
jgi:hypothetical protein